MPIGKVRIFLGGIGREIEIPFKQVSVVEMRHGRREGARRSRGPPLVAEVSLSDNKDTIAEGK